jgi:hypothetical protein
MPSMSWLRRPNWWRLPCQVNKLSGHLAARSMNVANLVESNPSVWDKWISISLLIFALLFIHIHGVNEHGWNDAAVHCRQQFGGGVCWARLLGGDGIVHFRLLGPWWVFCSILQMGSTVHPSNLILNTHSWTIDAHLTCIFLQKLSEKNKRSNSVMRWKTLITQYNNLWETLSAYFMF